MSDCSAQPATKSSAHGAGSPLRGARLLLVLLLLGGFIVSLPGCSGCISDPATAAKKKADEEAAKKKKKQKDSEKPKPDFEQMQTRLLPSNDPTLAKKVPSLHIKAGHWAAVSASTKANNYDFVGELATFVEQPLTNPVLPLELDDTNSRISVWRPASLPKGQTKRFESLIFIPKRKSVSGLNYPLRSELRGQRGGSIVEVDSFVATETLREYQHLFVVLSSNPATYSSLGKLHSISMPEVDAGGMGSDPLQYYYVLAPNVERSAPLAEHSLAWTSTAFVLWDDINPDILTAEQQQAMLDWLHWGGQIIISGPGSLDKLRGKFLHAYLPAEAAETVKLDEGAFAELNQTWSLSDAKKRFRQIKIIPDRPMVGIRFKKHVDAVEVPGTGGLVVERRIGQGRIVATAFPLSDVRIKQWKNFDGFFNNVLLRRPPRRFSSNEWANLSFEWDDRQLRSMRLEPRLGSAVRYLTRDVGRLKDDPTRRAEPAVTLPEVMPGAAIAAGQMYSGIDPRSLPIDTTTIHPDVDDWHFAGYEAAPRSGVAAWSDDSAVSNSVRQSLTEAAGIEIPRADFVFKVLAIYLAVLVPLNWFVFWILGRVEWAWIAAPLIAVVGAGAVIRLAQLDIGFARSRTEIAVLEVQGGYDRAHLTRYTALYTSLSSTYTLAFEETSALALPFASPATGALTEAQQIAAINDVRFRIGQDKSLTGVLVQSNSTGMVHSEQMFDLGGKLTLLGDDAQGWTIKNTSSVTIREAGILRRTPAGVFQSAFVAKLEAGTSSPLAFAPLPLDADGLVARWWLPEWEKSTVLGYGVAGPDASRVRLTRVARLAAEQLRLLPGDVRLVGWTDEDLPGMSITPHAPQNTMYTLVVAHLVRGALVPPRPDANVAEDFYEPPLEVDAEGNPIEPPQEDTGVEVPEAAPQAPLPPAPPAGGDADPAEPAANPAENNVPPPTNEGDPAEAKPAEEKPTDETPAGQDPPTTDSP